MKRLSLLLLITFCAEKPIPEPTDTREPIAAYWVSAPELKVHTKPDEASPVAVVYQNGERVSVLAERGEWVEIRTGDGSGWARRADLGSAEQAKQQEENPVPRFRTAPPAVTHPTAKGDIYIEADVNTDGDVVATQVISNSTGVPELAAQNEAALKQAKFYPIVQQGERKPFKYYHRVIY